MVALLFLLLLFSIVTWRFVHIILRYSFRSLILSVHRDVHQNSSTGIVLYAVKYSSHYPHIVIKHSQYGQCNCETKYLILIQFKFHHVASGYHNEPHSIEHKICMPRFNHPFFCRITFGQLRVYTIMNSVLMQGFFLYFWG